MASQRHRVPKQRIADLIRLSLALILTVASLNSTRLFPTFAGVSWSPLQSRTSHRSDTGVVRAAEKETQTRVIAVAGATGRTGQLVVDYLLKSGRAEQVIALVRNTTKAAEVFDADDSRIQIVSWDSADQDSTIAACKGAAAAIWCAEGDGIAAMSSAFCREKDQTETPLVVMCSSAAITRPTWSEPKKKMFEGVADIPIVRLNPGGILGAKVAAEDVLRRSGARYTIVRPTGLKDINEWPVGRPILSQGDFAVGRTSRADLASLLVALLDEPESVGKTFESVSVAGYPRPLEYSKPLSLLKKDGSRGIFDGIRRLFGGGQQEAEIAKYGLLQQLLPGEEQNAAGLAMGQTYEQYDKGEVGRLGPRGEEKVPERIIS